MTQRNATTSHFPGKIFLAMFIFGLLVLSGRFLFSRFFSLATTFQEIANEPDLASVAGPEFFHQSAINTGREEELGLPLYQSEISRADVLWFYSHITKNEEMARIILENASKNSIDPPLAFALAWEESRYTPRAVNKNAASIDRGLFQLNNKAFPKLTEKDFFNAATNAKFGLSHLRYCIDLSGNEVAALAMYNAGTTKVRNDNTPKRTLDYISRIMAYKEGLEKTFAREVAGRYSVDKKGNVRLKSGN